MMKKAMSSRRVRCPDLPPVEEEQTQSKKHFKDRRIWWKKTVSDRQAKKGKEASSSDNVMPTDPANRESPVHDLINRTPSPIPSFFELTHDMDIPVPLPKMTDSNQKRLARENSPSAVDDFPAASQEPSETTKKTDEAKNGDQYDGCNRLSVSNYFHAGCSVLPLPLGMEDETVRSYSSGNSRQRPLFPSTPSYIKHNPNGKENNKKLKEEGVEGDVPTVHIRNAFGNRDTRRTRVALAEAMQKRHSYRQFQETTRGPPSMMTQGPPITTSLKPSSKAMEPTSDEKNVHDTKSPLASQEQEEQSQPKEIPADPHAEILIPIGPEKIPVPLRRAAEVQSALEHDFYGTLTCACCSRHLAVIADAAYVHCPVCETIRPITGTIKPVGNFAEEPESLRQGLGLGMTWDTMKKVHQELFPEQYDDESVGLPAYSSCLASKDEHKA